MHNPALLQVLTINSKNTFISLHSVLVKGAATVGIGICHMAVHMITHSYLPGICIQIVGAQIFFWNNLGFCWSFQAENL